MIIKEIFDWAEGFLFVFILKPFIIKSMKTITKLLLVPLLISSFALTGCDPADWNLWYTPELFLKQADNKNFNTRVYSAKTNQSSIPDYEYTIRDLIREVGPFKKRGVFKAEEKEYRVVYSIYATNSYSGKRGQLTLSDKGLASIIYSDGSLFSASKQTYYSFDVAKAPLLFAGIEERIKDVNDMMEEDSNNARTRGGMSNFLSALEESGKPVPFTCWDLSEDQMHSSDNGSLLELLKTITFQETDNPTPVGDNALSYNYGDEKELNVKGWYFELNEDYRNLALNYDYTNRFGEEHTEVIYYKLAKDDGRAIITLAKSIAKGTAN